VLPFVVTVTVPSRSTAVLAPNYDVPPVGAETDACVVSRNEVCATRVAETALQARRDRDAVCGGYIACSFDVPFRALRVIVVCLVCEFEQAFDTFARYVVGHCVWVCRLG